MSDFPVYVLDDSCIAKFVQLSKDSNVLLHPMLNHSTHLKVLLAALDIRNTPCEVKKSKILRSRAALKFDLDPFLLISDCESDYIRRVLYATETLPSSSI